MFYFLPFCFQCGTNDNPCKCKILGPTLGFLCGVVTAIVLIPAGAVTYPFNKQSGRKLFALPVDINYKVTNGIPI